VDADAIARPLALTMLLPLGVAFLVKAFLPRRAERLQPIMNKVASMTLVALVALTFVANLGTILGMFGTGAILASALLIGGAFAVGYLFGGFGEHKREEMALCTASRNYAAAMVVATQSFDDPNALVMVVVLSVVSMALLFPAARALRGRAANGAAPQRGPQTAG
jgi:BASS family bile acid:Na+ symporter